MSRGTRDSFLFKASSFAYRVFTFYDGAFQLASARSALNLFEGPATPFSKFEVRGSILVGISLWPIPSFFELLISNFELQEGFGLFPFRSPLLGESSFLSFPPGTKMFQFPECPPLTYFISVNGDGGSPPPGFPIRKSPDLRLPAAPRGLSQLATSFFGPKRQGIRRTPLLS